MKLIRENEILLSRILGTFDDYRPHLKRVKEKYEACAGFTFTADTWRDIKNGNLEKLKDDIINRVNDELSRSGVENKILRKQAIDAISNQLPEFEEEASRLLSFRVSRDYPTLKITDICFSDERFFITEETKEEILEKYCRTYLNDECPITMELYELAARLAETATKLKQRLLDEGIYVHPYNDAWILNYITDQDKGYQPNVPEVNHVAAAIKEKSPK